MRIIVSTILSGAMALALIGASVQPAEAAFYKGWFNFGGKATSMTRTFNDGSPARTRIAVFLQKKAGPGSKCRARVTVRSGGYASQSKYLYKYTRNRTKAFGGTINWPNRVKRTTITIKTNGRCIYRVYAR